MAIGTTYGDTIDRGRGNVYDAQVRGGQDSAAKGGTSVLDLTGDMAVVRSASRNSEGGEGEHNGGTEGAARFPACAVGRDILTGASSRCKHGGVTGRRHGQQGLG